MAKEEFKERLKVFQEKALEVNYPFELRQLLMHFFLVAEAESLKEAIDKKLLDDLCAVYYSIEAIELFSQPLVKNHLFKICIDRTLMIFEEMMQRVDGTSQ